MAHPTILPLASLLALSLLAPPDAPLSVTDAVKLALRQSPKLRAARAERDVALAQNGREKPVARPSVNVEAVGQFQGPRVAFPRSDGGDDTIVPERYGRMEVTVEQILYRAGASAARERFSAQNRSAEWDLRKAEQGIAVDVVRAYGGLASAEAQITVAREGVEMARRQLELTRTMQTAGTASERDVKASDADLAEAELGLTRAANGAALGRANLNRVLGRDPSTEITLSATEPLPAAPPAPDEGQRIGLERRAELHLLDENIEAARAGTQLAATQNQPTLSARAIAAAQTPTALTGTKFFAAGVALKWSPFDQAKTRADVQEARARVAQLEALREDARLGVRLEIQKAWLDMRTAAEKIAVAERQVSSANAALDVSRLRYEAGSATQLEVSGSLFALIKARTNRVQAESDLRLAHAEFSYATGQGVPSDLSPVTLKEPKNR